MPDLETSTHPVDQPDANDWKRRELHLAFVNTVKLGSSLLLTWSIAIVTRLYIPRFLGPERFGSLNFAEAFTATAFVALGLGMDTYVRKEISVRPGHANDFIGGIIALRAILSVLIFGAMEIVLRRTHAGNEIRYLVYLYGFAQVFTVGGLTSAGLLQAVGKVNEMSVLSVLIKIAWAIGVFAAIVFRAGLWAFALTVTITESVKSLVLYALARKHLGLRLRVQVRATWLVIIAALPFFISGLATTVYDKMGVNLLEYWTTRKEVGWFGAAAGFSSMTLLFVPLLSWILVPLLARSAAESLEDLFSVTRRSLEFILSLALPVATLMITGADVFISILFGKAFSPASMALRVLAVVTLLTYVSIVAAYALAVLNRTWRMSFTFLGAMLINPTCNIILIRPMLARFGPGGGGTACAIASLVTEIAVVTSLLVALGSRTFDRRLILTTSKGVAVALFVILLDHFALRSFGIFRLVVDTLTYAILASVTGALDVRGLIALARSALRQRRLRRAG